MAHVTLPECGWVGRKNRKAQALGARAGLPFALRPGPAALGPNAQTLHPTTYTHTPHPTLHTLPTTPHSHHPKPKLWGHAQDWLQHLSDLLEDPASIATAGVSQVSSHPGGAAGSSKPDMLTVLNCCNGPQVSARQFAELQALGRQLEASANKKIQLARSKLKERVQQGLLGLVSGAEPGARIESYAPRNRALCTGQERPAKDLGEGGVWMRKEEGCGWRGGVRGGRFWVSRGVRGRQRCEGELGE